MTAKPASMTQSLPLCEMSTRRSIIGISCQLLVFGRGIWGAKGQGACRQLK